MSYSEQRALLAQYTCKLRKHRGKLWSQVLDEDEDYCRWAMLNMDEDPDYFPDELRQALVAILDE